MHPKVYQQFERICAERNAGGRVLEIGAIPSDKSLLCMRVLKDAIEKVGVNLKGPYRYRDFLILKRNANAMDCFVENTFDTVLCNAVLEHDKQFWLTIAEIKRVTRSGGLIVLGAPGYSTYKIETIKSIFKKIPLFRKLKFSQYWNALFTTTITYQIHGTPGDYYRFSQQTFTEVLFEDMLDVQVISVMAPPRIIGSGIKP